MAKVVYDGREYPVADEDVHAIIEAVKNLVTAEPGWLALGASEGVVQLLISPGVNIAIVSGGPESPLDVLRREIGSEEPINRMV